MWEVALDDHEVIFKLEMIARTWCMDKGIVSGLFLCWNKHTGS